MGEVVFIYDCVVFGGFVLGLVGCLDADVLCFEGCYVVGLVY